jgi:hypothetical protein
MTDKRIFIEPFPAAATNMYKMDTKLQEYFKRFNDTIGKTDSADKILEGAVV